MKNLNLILAAATLIFTLAACSMLNSGPSRTLKQFYGHVEAGELDAAVKLMSKSVVNGMGEQKMKAMLGEAARKIKQKGGIASIEIQKEEVTGEIADVSGIIKYKNRESENLRSKLVKEDGSWKIGQ